MSEAYFRQIALVLWHWSHSQCTRKLCRPALPGPRPKEANLRLRRLPPDRHAGMLDPNDTIHPLDLSIEVHVAQEAANEDSHFICSKTRDEQAMASMAEARVTKVYVASEKCELRSAV